jgi:hypothetical protein
MSSQEIFLLIDADNISPAVDRAIRNNKPEKIAQMSQDIERGDKLLRSWLEERGGRVLLFHGDEIYASVAGERLAELGKLHEELQEAWNDTITIGVGLDLREAKKALDAGKKRGGSRILFYAPEIEQMVGGDEESQSDSHVGKTPSPDPDKLKSLNKSNTPTHSVQPRGVHAIKHQNLRNDTSGASPFTPQQPISGGSSEMPPPPSSTNMADGLSPVERQFHQMASQGEAEVARAEGQANAAAQGGSSGDELKQKISQILQAVKAQAPVLEQLQSQAPEAYQAVVGAIQAMILMAKTFSGGSQEAPQEEQEAVKKSEQFFEEALFKSATDIRRIRAAAVNDETSPEKLSEMLDYVKLHQRALYNEGQLAWILKDFANHPKMDGPLEQKFLTNFVDNKDEDIDTSDALPALLEARERKPLTPEMESFLSNHPESHVRRKLAGHEARLSPAALDKLIQDKSPDVLDRVARRVDLNETQIGSLLDNKRVPGHRKPQLLISPQAPLPHLLKQLSSKGLSEGQKTQLLNHPKVPQEYMDKFVAAYEKVVRAPPKVTASSATKEKHARAVMQLKELIQSPKVPFEKAKELYELRKKHFVAARLGYAPTAIEPFARDPDSVHAANGVKPTIIKPGLHKIRKIRDSIEAKGGEVKPAELGGAAQALGKIGRLPNGNFSSKELQSHIDSLPGIPVYLTEGKWDGGQQHSKDASKVLRVSLPTAATEAMLKQGVTMNEGHNSDHPGEPVSGLGWIRYTGDDKGLHIDEIQHDFGSENEKKFRTVLGHPVHQVLHDAFHEFARQKYPVGTPVHIWTPESKAPLSDQDPDEPLPVHMRNTYGAGPEKMNYQPTQYGSLPTQKSKSLKGNAVWADQVRKKEDELGKAYEIVGGRRETKRTGIDNQVKVQNTDFSIKKSSLLRGPRAIAKAAGTKVEPRMDRPYPQGTDLDKEELPTPEEQAKHNTPAKPHGGIAIHVEGQNTVMPFREFHQDPGQAAHISNSGKVEGKTVYRRSYSGRVLPDNHAEAMSGAGHINGVSGRDAKDGKASDPQPGPNPGGGQNPSGKH